MEKREEIAFVAQDFAPSVALDLLSKEIGSRGFEVSATLGFGKTKLDTTELRCDAHLLVCGMGSSAELARAEFNAIVCAHARGVPIALYADVWDCAAREWFMSLRSYISLLFVVDEEELSVGRQLFPNARVVVSGNPLWERSRYTTYPRTDVRTNLHVRDEKVIVCALTKNRAVNFDLIRGVQNIARAVGGRGLVCPHPGDTTPKEQYRSVIGNDRRTSAIEAGTATVLSGADLILNAASGVGIEAVMQGIPVLEYQTPHIEKEIARIYPHGWRLPEKFPRLVTVAATDSLVVHATKALEQPLLWTGVVGQPATLHSVQIMANELELLL